MKQQKTKQNVLFLVILCSPEIPGPEDYQKCFLSSFHSWLYIVYGKAKQKKKTQKKNLSSRYRAPHSFSRIHIMFGNVNGKAKPGIQTKKEREKKNRRQNNLCYRKYGTRHTHIHTYTLTKYIEWITSLHRSTQKKLRNFFFFHLVVNLISIFHFEVHRLT